MGRRRQHQHQTQYVATHPRRQNCCSSRHQHHRNAEAYTSNTYYPQPPAPLPQQDFYPRAKPSDYHQPPRRKSHGPVSMAALLIGAVGLGAQKIQEKREKKKEKKAVLAWEEEQSFETARKAALDDAWEIRTQDRRKSQEAAEERRGGGRDGLEGGEAPPPSYEDVVGNRIRGRGEGSAGRSWLNV